MDDPCNRCVRHDFPMHLAVYAAVPKEAALARPALSGNFGAGVTDKPLTESVYMLRSPDPGWVYLLCGKAWRGYLIDAAGYPNFYPNLSIEDMPDAVPAESKIAICARTGKKHTGVEAISIPAPDLIEGPVYIKYSRHKWTKAIRKEIAKNPAEHMQQVMSLDGSPFAHAEVASVENLRKWVVDFDANAVRAVNKHLPEGAQVQDRSANAEGIVKAMLASSGALKTPGVIMALHDDVGITMRTAALRNRLAFERAQVEKKYEQDLFIRQAAEGFKRQCDQHAATDPQARKKAALYAKAYDSAALDKALKARQQELTPLDKRLNSASADWLLWAKSPRLATWFGHTYDPAELASGLDCITAAAECLSGAGTTPPERDLVGSWLQGDITDPGNLIWTALAGNQKGLLQALMAQKGSMQDSFKNAWGAADEYEKALPPTQQGLLVRMRMGGGPAGSADLQVAALSRLFYVVATNLHAGMKLTGTLALRVTVLAAVWSGVRYGAHPLKMGLREAALAVKQAVWGGAPASQLKLLDSGPTLRVAQFNLASVADALQLPPQHATLSVTGLVPLELKQNGSGLWVPIEYVEPVPAHGAVVMARPVAPEGMASNPKGRLWLPEELAQAITPKGHWKRTLQLLREGGANGTLAGGVFVFQMIAFFDALNALETASEAELLENGLQFYSGLLGMVGAASEITGAAIQLRSAVDGAKLVRGSANFVRGVTVIGGMVGAAAGVVTAVSTTFKLIRLNAYGDKDAAFTYGALAFVTAAGSFTAGAGALAASSAAASATGAASIVGTSGTILGLGPFAWAAVTVGLICAGIYLAIKADDETDDPIERWLKRSKYGIAKEKFRDAAQEREEFAKLYELPLRIELRTLASGNSTRRDIEVRVTAPALDAESTLSYDITVVQGYRQQHRISDTLALKGSKSAPKVSGALQELQSGGNLLLRVHDLTRVGDGVGVVRWLVNARCVQRGGSDPRNNGRVAQMSYCEVTALSVQVRYQPQAQKDPQWVLPFEQQMSVAP